MPNRARRSHKANRGWRTSSRQGGGPFRRLFSAVFLAALLAGALISEAARLDLSYGRPYFMPASKRAQILRLTTTDEKRITADMAVNGKCYELIATKPADKAKPEIEALWKKAKPDEPGVDALLLLADNPWMRFFLAYDPLVDL